MLPSIEERIILLPEWEQLQPEQFSGLILLIGETDTGKSTLAKYLEDRLEKAGKKVALIDGDPGQTSQGPPGTITAVMRNNVKSSVVKGKNVTSNEVIWRWFIGSTSPAGHMLPMIVGSHRLVQAVFSAGVSTVIYDTCGLITPLGGGVALKLAKIDLLQPSLVVAIQRQYELEPLLQPLRRSQRVKLVELRPSPAVRPRDPSARRSHRANQFAEYFKEAGLLSIHWPELAVFPAPHFRTYQLVGLEDANGFLEGLGIIQNFTTHLRQVTIRTPLTSLEKIDALHLGDLLVDPETFQDTRIEAQS